MADWLAAALRARDAGTEQPFATLDPASGRVIGSTRFLAIAAGAPAPRDRLDVAGTGGLGHAAPTWRPSSC